MNIVISIPSSIISWRNSLQTGIHSFIQASFKRKYSLLSPNSLPFSRSLLLSTFYFWLLLPLDFQLINSTVIRQSISLGVPLLESLVHPEQKSNLLIHNDYALRKSRYLGSYHVFFTFFDDGFDIALLLEFSRKRPLI